MAEIGLIKIMSCCISQFFILYHFKKFLFVSIADRNILIVDVNT